MFLDERTTLDLSRRDLAEVPDWVWQRSELETLFLGWNRIRDVPASVGRLAALTHLYSCTTTFSTSVPGELTGLRELRSSRSQSQPAHSLAA